MILLRSVIFLALVGAGVWYFLAEPDRQAEIAAIEQELRTEAGLRQDSLTATLQRFKLATVLVARSAPVAALVTDKPEPERQQPVAPESVDGTGLAWPVAPPAVVSADDEKQKALANLASLEVLTGLETIRILKKGESETLPAVDPPAGLLADGRWESGINAAFNGSSVRAAFRDEGAGPAYMFFTPYVNGTEVPAIIIADAPLGSEKSRWQASGYRLTLTGADGKIILANDTRPAGNVIEISRDIPALNAVLTVATAQPDPLGPWAIRSGAAVLIAILLLFVWELNLARRRLRSQAVEARLLPETKPADVVFEKASGAGHNRDRLSSGESLTLLGQVSESIGQEINRPLSAIRSHAEAASRSVDKGEMDMARSNIRQVSDLAERISRVIANMRGFAASRPYQIEPVSIRPVVHDAAVKMLELAPGIGDFFFMEVADDVDEKAFVRADKKRLSQVIESMLSSSWDACREQEEPELVISILQTRGNMIVAIDFSGDPDDMVEQEHKRISTGAVAEASGPVGRGVSFTIAKSIVEGMGGRLIHKASALGGGRVEIVLPKFRPNSM